MKRKMSKMLALLLAVIMAMSTATMVSAKSLATSISIKGSVKTIYVGQVKEFDSRIRPAYVDIPDRNIIWSSSNSKVLKVLEKKDDDTKVKALKSGTATLTVKIKGTNIKASRTITVKKNKTTSVSSYEKKITGYKNSLKTIFKDMRAEKAEAGYSARYQQVRAFEKRIDKIDNKLDALEDTIEYKYDSGKISNKQYRSLEKKIDSVENYMDDMEDYLEDKFGDFDD